MIRRRRTRIVATLGPASRAPAMVLALAEAGVDVFRLNFSHGTHEDHARALKGGGGAPSTDRRGAPAAGGAPPGRGRNAAGGPASAAASTSPPARGCASTSIPRPATGGGSACRIRK